MSCLLPEEVEVKESHICTRVPEFSLCSPLEGTLGFGLQSSLWKLKLFFNIELNTLQL